MMALRSQEGDENQSPNKQFFRESTPETDSVSEGVLELPPGSWNKPYSPGSNPFGERPSQRTPGARSFIRRLSTHSSLSGGLVTDVMAGATILCPEDGLVLSTDFMKPPLCVTLIHRLALSVAKKPAAAQ